jgi:hypothetical protein
VTRYQSRTSRLRFRLAYSTNDLSTFRMDGWSYLTESPEVKGLEITCRPKPIKKLTIESSLLSWNRPDWSPQCSANRLNNLIKWDRMNMSGFLFRIRQISFWMNSGQLFGGLFRRRYDIESADSDSNLSFINDNCEVRFEPGRRNWKKCQSSPLALFADQCSDRLQNRTTSQRTATTSSDDDTF